MLGEEHGESGKGRRRWIVDPIDGTRNYSRGVPVWATLIALEEDGEVQLGVVSAPALGRRWYAERGGGAWAGDDRVRVSSVHRVEDAVLSFALEQPLPALAAQAWHARGYGDFWSHMLVAEGAVDGAIDAIGVSLWDLAAVQVIVEEAGRHVHRLPRRAAARRRLRDLLERPPARRAARSRRARQADARPGRCVTPLTPTTAAS